MIILSATDEDWDDYEVNDVVEAFETATILERIRSGDGEIEN